MSSVGKAKSMFVMTALLVMAAASVAIFPSASSTTVSAQTAGIVTSDLALNLDPNLTSSYSGSGTTVTDLSGNNRHGTVGGTPLPSFDGVSPKSFEFTKEWVSNTASAAGKISINEKFLTDNFTIQTWIKTSQVGYSTAHYTTMYIMASECGGTAPDWGLGVNNSGQLAFGAGPSDATFSTTEVVNTNEWTNVAASRDKTTGEIKLYINGVLKQTGTGQSGNSLTCSADDKTWIGNGQDAPAYSFGGKISSVLAYSRVLSAADILTNYNATVNTFYPVTYTITYDANGATSGSVPSNGSFTSGGPATTISANSGSLMRTGYTFAGWNSLPNGTGTTYAAGSSTYSTNADITLYAMWTAIPVETTTTVVTTTTQPPAAVIDIQAPVAAVSQTRTPAVRRSPSRAKTVPTGTPANTTSAKSTNVTTTTIGSLTTSTTSTPPPVIPRVSAGETALDVDGAPADANVTRENNQLVIKSESVEATVSSRDQKGTIRPLDPDGNLRFVSGDVVAINLKGFKPGSDVDVWLFSTPTKLGTTTVGTDGRVSGSFTLPEDVESGQHRIAVTAELPNGKKATFTVGIIVGEIAKTSTLTRVLIAIPIALAVGFGLLLPTRLRRRRTNTIV